MYIELSDTCPYSSDDSFDSFFPKHIREISKKHWTPINVAQTAAQFLAEGPGKILDIGSGIGKFCLTAAYHHPHTQFYGVEQRIELISYATLAKGCHNLSNVHFLHSNITQIDFNEFNHFYFFNSFYENIDTQNRIDQKIQAYYSLYNYYSQYLYNILEEKPIGTRIATYHSSEHEIPLGFEVVDSYYDGKLKMWLKIN